jgi:mannose-1-phosphate guanylyltransferase
MNQPNIYLVIIAGGSGTRFWPKSTSKRPKQLLSFGSNDGSSLLSQTLARFDHWIPNSQRIIVTTQTLHQAIEEEGIDAKVLAEPQGRNTAPCVYWAARHIAEQDPHAIMLVMPADHYIPQLESFLSVVKKAADWAHKNHDLVTLGVRPTRPETGYGYLKVVQDPLHSRDPSAQKVAAFVEKPNHEKAKDFLNSGNYLWNGGMFAWSVNTILNSFDQFMPEMKKAWDKADGIPEKAYPQMTATSIDYGVMEKAENVVTFTLDCGWDDLGSWTSLEGLAESLHAKQNENVITAGQLISVDSKNNIIDVPQRLVALLGVQDLIIVEHGESLLIAKKERAQDIRQIVEEVKKTRPDLA